MARSLINAAKQIAEKSITLNLLAQSIQDELAQIQTNKTDIAAIIASKGVANGIATLDAGGKLQTAQLPALAIGDTVTVASEAAMFALTTTQVQTGDVVVVATGDITTQKTYRVIDSTKLNSADGAPSKQLACQDAASPSCKKCQLIHATSLPFSLIADASISKKSAHAR